LGSHFFRELAIGIRFEPSAHGEPFGIQPMFAITALACLILGVLGVRWLFLARGLLKKTA
jgi:hypothetical protein